MNISKRMYQCVSNQPQKLNYSRFWSLTLPGIREYTRNKVTNITPFLTPSPLPLFHIQSSPALIIASPKNPIPSIATIPAKNFKQIEAIESTELRLLYVNDITGSMRTWVHAHTPPSQYFGKLPTSSNILKHYPYILKYLMTTNPLRWLLCQTWHIRFQKSRPIIFSTVATYPTRTNHFIVGSVSWSISSPHPAQYNHLNSLMSISSSINRF